MLGLFCFFVFVIIVAVATRFWGVLGAYISRCRQNWRVRARAREERKREERKNKVGWREMVVRVVEARNEERPPTYTPSPPEPCVYAAGKV